MSALAVYAGFQLSNDNHHEFISYLSKTLPSEIFCNMSIRSDGIMSVVLHGSHVSEIDIQNWIRKQKKNMINENRIQGRLTSIHIKHAKKTIHVLCKFKIGNDMVPFLITKNNFQEKNEIAKTTPYMIISDSPNFYFDPVSQRTTKKNAHGSISSKYASSYRHVYDDIYGAK